MELPKKWSDISLETYLEIRAINAAEFQGMSRMMVETLSILSGESVEEIDELEVKQIKKLYESVRFVNDTPRAKVQNSIELEGESLFYKGMGLTLGEYIDLLGWNSGEIKADLIAALLYRRTRINEWGEVEFQPRNYNVSERAEKIRGLSVAHVWGCVNAFRDFNTMIREKYGDLFPEPEQGEIEGEEEEKKVSKRRTIGEQKHEAKEKALQTHQWIKFVDDLCGGDITKRDEVLRTPVIYVFNIMGMKHDLKES